jgi:hypothetical protein
MGTVILETGRTGRGGSIISTIGSGMSMDLHDQMKIGSKKRRYFKHGEFTKRR